MDVLLQKTCIGWHPPISAIFVFVFVFVFVFEFVFVFAFVFAFVFVFFFVFARPGWGVGWLASPDLGNHRQHNCHSSSSAHPPPSILLCTAIHAIHTITAIITVPAQKLPPAQTHLITKDLAVDESHTVQSSPTQRCSLHNRPQSNPKSVKRVDYKMDDIGGGKIYRGDGSRCSDYPITSLRQTWRREASEV